MLENLDYLRVKLENFQKALNKLAKILNVSEDVEYKIDAVIKRFEFTYELSWKLLKAVLEYKGLIAKTPRDCFKEAFAAGIIDDSDAWVNMIEDRNLISHTYQEDSANEIYENIKEVYFAKFKELESLFLKEIE
ncbi:MAG: nucleotidyltransferase substrate binding protein [Candidatus Margulisiibacteriota bacterium]|jgi:nucleotidyltransferase substrate binding protein (TIGR01987 family)